MMLESHSMLDVSIGPILSYDTRSPV